MIKKMHDITLVGFAVNPEAAGKNNKYHNFLDSIGAKFLYNSYYNTYTTEPMALLHLAAQCQKRQLLISVIDGIIQNLDKKELLVKLINANCNIFAFTMYDTSEKDVIELISELKKHKPNATIITGGSYATIEYKKILELYKDIDFIIIGDGDYALPNLVKAIHSGEEVSDIKNLAFRSENRIIVTEREVVDLNKQAITSRIFAPLVIEKGFSLGVNTTRGCSHGKCSFCYLKDYQSISCQPKIRYRSAEKIISELKYLVGEFGIKKITFCDDDFFGTNIEGIKRACELFELIIKNDIKLSIYLIGRVKTIQYMKQIGILPLMKEAGVSCVYLGIDSYNDDILNRYRKGITVDIIDEVIFGLHKNNMRINPGLITFEPVMTIDHVKQNIELFKKVGYYDAYMFTRVLVILPQMRKRHFNDKELDIYSNNYFYDSRTKILHTELSKYLDMILPLYRQIDRKLITEAKRQLLYDEHFKFFEYVYNELNSKNTVNTESYLDNCKLKIEMFINPIILTKEN